MSLLGSAVTRLALPLIALLMLGPTPAQMGVLVASQTAPMLLIGLAAGAWGSSPEYDDQAPERQQPQAEEHLGDEEPIELHADEQDGDLVPAAVLRLRRAT